MSAIADRVLAAAARGVAVRQTGVYGPANGVGTVMAGLGVVAGGAALVLGVREIAEHHQRHVAAYGEGGGRRAVEELPPPLPPRLKGRVLRGELVQPPVPGSGPYISAYAGGPPIDATFELGGVE